MNEPTNYEKGLSFEEQFAEYMKTELGYDKIRIRKAMMSNSNSKGHEADIIGVEHDPRLEGFNTAAYVFFGLSIFVLVGVGIELIAADYAFLPMMTGLGSLTFIGLGQLFTDKHTWVECKNRKSKTGFDQMKSFIDKVAANNSSKDRKHKIVRKIYVSANGFVNNAHELATENGVQCFVFSSGEFQEVKYWH